MFNGDLGTGLVAKQNTPTLKQDELNSSTSMEMKIVHQRSEWYKIRLAYAMSIHKSQGSEFLCHPTSITRSSHRMLQRTWSTAITRAKSKLDPAKVRLL